MSQAADVPHSRRLAVAHLVLAVPWVALVIGAWRPIRDNSFLWHVRAGTLQADQNSVLTADPFSFTMLGESWRTQSWLVELLYGWAEGVTGGLAFVPVMLLMASAMTFFCVGLIAYRSSQSVSATAFVVVLTTIALISFQVPRPVLFSYLLMALVILTWERPTYRWTVPFLFWLWAGAHASFFIGLGYVGLSIIAKREWRAIPAATVAGVVTLGTAHGLGVVGFLLDFGANSDALQYLGEWRRPDLFEPMFLPFLGGILFIVIGAFRGRIHPKHLWLIVPFLVLGLSSVRAVPAAWLGLVPLVALSLSGLEIGSRVGLRPRLAAVFLLLTTGLPFLLMSDGRLSEERFPVAATRELADLPTFHDDRTGGFLIWAEGPDRLVYIDDRAELYGSRMEEFVMVRRRDLEWEPIFERDGIEQVLLANSEQLIGDLVAREWQIVHADDHFTVLRRPLT